MPTKCSELYSHLQTLKFPITDKDEWFAAGLLLYCLMCLSKDGYAIGSLSLLLSLLVHILDFKTKDLDLDKETLTMESDSLLHGAMSGS
jgi:hypothetical protein